MLQKTLKIIKRNNRIVRIFQKQIIQIAKEQQQSSKEQQQRSRINKNCQIMNTTGLKSFQSQSLAYCQQVFQHNQHCFTSHLLSLLPQAHLLNVRPDSSISQQTALCSDLSFFDKQKQLSLRLKSKKRTQSVGLPQIIRNIACQWIVGDRTYDQVFRELQVDTRKIDQIQEPQARISYVLNEIHKSINEQQRKFANNKNTQPSNTQCQPQNISTLAMASSGTRMTQSKPNKDPVKKTQSKYQAFLKEQSKVQTDNFGWLQLKTKYPRLEKKLKSKLIQTINQDKNQKRLRQLIQMKANKSCLNQSNLKSGQKQNVCKMSDQKLQLYQQQVSLQQFQNNTISYTWTSDDECLFQKNIKCLKQKCSSDNSLFLKLCSRFSFISQSQFSTLALEQISRKLTKSNKLYLSRQCLLDKYYSTTEVLTDSQKKFILKTSPMLSRCVDRNFIRQAIRNVNWDDILNMELNIAQDIIAKWDTLRKTVTQSRKLYKNAQNQYAKIRIIEFEKAKEFQVARQMARQQLQKHQIHFMRSLNYQNKRTVSAKKNTQLTTSKKTKSKANIWTPLNKFHPSTGLFVKDCNQQCTDDLFNSYQKQYLKTVSSGIKSIKPSRNMQTKCSMLRFLTGGPDQNLTQSFPCLPSDIHNICSIIKSFYFQKQIHLTLQSIQIQQCPSSNRSKTQREETKCTQLEIKTRKTMQGTEKDMESIAKRKIQEGKVKAKATVYVNKLLHLATNNNFQALKALTPTYTVEEVNSKDKNGNTALYYASKFGNQQFTDFLLKFGADPNILCEKKSTPIHAAFSSNNLQTILRLLTSTVPTANLNLIDSQNKTPLAYCSRQILKKLNLESGIVFINPKNSKSINFNNNSLLQKQQLDKIRQKRALFQGQFSKRMINHRQSKLDEQKSIKKQRAATSIKNLVSSQIQ